MCVWFNCRRMATRNKDKVKVAMGDLDDVNRFLGRAVSSVWMSVSEASMVGAQS